MSSKCTLIDVNGTPYKYLVGENLPIPLCKVVAKQIPTATFVLTSSEKGLFNPLEIDANLMKRDRIRGGRYYRLKRCGKSCYNSYVEFLRSKNRTHFILAQRRLLNEN